MKTKQSPAIFDNGGKTWDRYTIILPNGDMYGSSENPFHPLGFGQYCGNLVESYYNQTVSFFHLDRVRETEPKLYKRIVKQTVKEQLAIAKTDPEWLGEPVQETALPEPVQQYVKQLIA